MVSTPDQSNEEPKQPGEVTRKLVVASVVAESDPDDRSSSPSKVDRDGNDDLQAAAPESPEVVRDLVKPESIAATATSDDDRSPGKEDRTGIVSEATDAKPVENVRNLIVPDDLPKS